MAGKNKILIIPLVLCCLIISTNIVISGNIKSMVLSCASDSIIDALVKQDKRKLELFIKKNGPNQLLDSGRSSLLSFAVQQNKHSLVKFLIKKGANVDLLVNDFSPLMICATYNYDKIAKVLLKNNANVNLSNGFKNTSLIIASRYGNLETVKVLIRYGANPFYKNQTRQNALDYARNFNKNNVASYLEKWMKNYASNSLVDIAEGPFVDLIDEKAVSVKFIVHDAKKRKTRIIENQVPIIGERIIFKNPQTEIIDTIIKHDNHNSRNNSFRNIHKLFVVGDVHGEFEALVKLLKYNGVINNELKWSFGSGHLVFMGDIFDRGRDVTETLWMIYRLEHEAQKSGGFVHFILGNHEVMVLQGDLRYIHPEYEYMVASAAINYSELFSNQTLLGKWLRSKEAIVVIDSLLFTHAGISYDLVAKGITVESVNQIVKSQLNFNEFPDSINLEWNNLVIEENGPLWFRGYFGENSIIPVITNEEIEKTLKFYGVNKIIVGHTEVSKIFPIYNGRIIPVDVPFNREGIQSQGLLIIDSKFLKCFDDGHCESIEK